MRIKLTIELINKKENLPLNYQYELSSWIYKMINNSNTDFSNWLHKNGYSINNKNFKLFTFSNFLIPKFQIKNNCIQILSDKIEFIVSFYTEEIPEHFIIGIFKEQELSIGNGNGKANFKIQLVERIKDITFLNEMTYKCLSPIHIINKNSINNKTDHLSPEHKEYEKLFFANLVDKYNSINIGNERIFNLSKCSIELLSHPKSKLITIKSGKKGETKLKSFLFDFKMTAPIELQQVGYYAGFGKANSQGFGCVDLLND